MKKILLLLSLSVSVQAETFPEVAFREPFPTSDNDKRIIGEPNFEKIRDLSNETNVFNTARRVAFLNVNNESSCTGSLVGPDLILTNAHCVMDLGSGIMNDVTKISINMEYLSADERNIAHAQVTESVKTNPNLDYSLLRLDQPLGKYYGWLELSDYMPTSGDVMVIQHPYGREKELARVNSNIVKASPWVLHYYADTEPGSSGSPVFNLNGTKLIALHHAGACFEENIDPIVGCKQFDFNEGMNIELIKSEIEEFLPPCATDGVFPGELVNKCAYITE
jgi:hypothetical protein